VIVQKQEADLNTVKVKRAGQKEKSNMEDVLRHVKAEPREEDVGCCRFQSKEKVDDKKEEATADCLVMEFLAKRRRPLGTRRVVVEQLEKWKIEKQKAFERIGFQIFEWSDEGFLKKTFVSRAVPALAFYYETYNDWPFEWGEHIWGIILAFITETEFMVADVYANRRFGGRVKKILSMNESGDLEVWWDGKRGSIHRSFIRRRDLPDFQFAASGKGPLSFPRNISGDSS